MPTYEYECPACPRTFEVRQRISEPALATCERCGGPVRRLLSAAPFILKGEGWYVTDYPSESRKKARQAESAGAATEAKSSTPASTDSSSSAGSSSSGSATPASASPAAGSSTGTTESTKAKTAS